MGISIPKDILGFKGQRVNEIKLDQWLLSDAPTLALRCAAKPGVMCFSTRSDSEVGQ